MPSDIVARAGFSSSATFTPAAASHTAGDVVGGAKEFGKIAPTGGASHIVITSASILINTANAQATAWRLYLFQITPPSAVADDGAFTFASGDQASFIGQIDLGTAVDLGSTQYIEVNGINKQIKTAGSSVFGYLVNLTTLSTEAVSHVVTLYAVAV